MRERIQRIFSFLLEALRRSFHFVCEYGAGIFFAVIFVFTVGFLINRISWEIRQEKQLQETHGPCVYTGSAYLCEDEICDLSLRCVSRGTETILGE